MAEKRMMKQCFKCGSMKKPLGRMFCDACQAEIYNEIIKKQKDESRIVPEVPDRPGLRTEIKPPVRKTPSR
jgi:hypothetical protein